MTEEITPKEALARAALHEATADAMEKYGAKTSGDLPQNVQEALMDDHRAASDDEEQNASVVPLFPTESEEAKRVITEMLLLLASVVRSAVTARDAAFAEAKRVLSPEEYNGLRMVLRVMSEPDQTPSSGSPEPE